MASTTRKAAIAFVVAGGAVAAWQHSELRARMADEALRLEAIAAEGAALVDAAAPETIRSAKDAGSPAFEALRHELWTLKDRRKLGSPIYTLRRTTTGATEFVVMTNEKSFIGAPYVLRPEMAAVFDEAKRSHTMLYSDEHGWWISGYAPVLGQGGKAVALVSIDRPSADFAEQRTRAWLVGGLAGLIGAALAALISLAIAAKQGAFRSIRRIVSGRLAVRIGLAGTLSVLVAVGVVGFLDHRQSRGELIERLSQRLLTAVKVGAPMIDPALHQRVTDANSPEFKALQRTLRVIQENAELTSPVYTLRRDGEAARFVVMTNEVPFVGDSNELRPGVRRTFEGGGPGVDGPYADAHGDWLSAWAPIVAPSGEVVAVLQADYEIHALLDALRDRGLRRALFALAGIAVAFLAAAYLARGIARPIENVAQAASAIEMGKFDVEVPEAREDEVGELARAINKMARGLRERERLRDMFGKYMSHQVAQQLLERGELTLTGEVRDVSVMISDIRGYTALTETLGATEVVALLNEYFTILVDVVLEHEGVIDKFMGDAMLCWFGAPLPQEDHQARAVKAAMRIMERLAAWNGERAKRGLAPVATGIGIASGHVVVGNIGSTQRLEYTAIGDAVNLASRLCGKAEAGEVVITDQVRRGCSEDRFVDTGTITVKGVKDPVPVHRITLPTVVQ